MWAQEVCFTSSIFGIVIHDDDGSNNVCCLSMMLWWVDIVIHDDDYSDGSKNVCWCIQASFLHPWRQKIGKNKRSDIHKLAWDFISLVWLKRLIVEYKRTFSSSLLIILRRQWHWDHYKRISEDHNDNDNDNDDDDDDDDEHDVVVVKNSVSVPQQAKTRRRHHFTTMSLS